MPARIDSCSPASLPIDADLAADLRALRIELQLRRLDEAQLRGIVAIEAEVVDRIAIHRIERDFLAIEEHRLRRHRPGRHDVAIGEDQAALGVDDEAGRLARHVPLGVERARQVDLDRDDAARDPLERAGPARVFGVGDRHDAGGGSGGLARLGDCRRCGRVAGASRGSPVGLQEGRGAGRERDSAVLCMQETASVTRSAEQQEAPDHRQHGEG